MERNSQVPVLLRQYLRLGGRVTAFNVDRSFSNALDGLLVVDLRETSPKLLAKYMGAESATEFLRASRLAEIHHPESDQSRYFGSLPTPN